uniref:Uncharacterized protein n=1 Tax=Acrobeloides nanus TaxID=290746 RepID=A0A914DW23_9BILA
QFALENKSTASKNSLSTTSSKFSTKLPTRTTKPTWLNHQPTPKYSCANKRRTPKNVW